LGIDIYADFSVVTNYNIKLFFKKKKNYMKGHVGEMRGAIKNISKILILDNITTHEFA
jgi:hypothetical protein